MTWLAIRYSVGNEHDPPRAWAGHIDAAALDELLVALDQAVFPAVPPTPLLPPGAALRRLAVAADGIVQQVLISWERALPLPGYAEAFDLIDAVIRQLSADAVTYPAKRAPVVHGAVAVSP